MFLTCFKSEAVMRPSVPVLAPLSHHPSVVQPAICEGQEKRDDLNDKDETLISVPPALCHDSVEFHRKAGKIVKKEDGDETKGEFADAAVDVSDVPGGPQPRDACDEEVGSGAEHGEGKVGAHKVVSVRFRVESEVARVVSDGEADGEEVESEQDHRV